MTARKLPTRVALLQATAVLTLLASLTASGLYVWDQHQRLQSQLSGLEPRYARLIGLLQRGADYKSASEQAHSRIAALTYPASVDASQAANDAQERIRRPFTDSKLDIVSIQVLPPPPKEEQNTEFERIQILLKIEGELVGIQNALSTLATLSPPVWIESTTLQTIGAARPASVQRLGGQFVFSVYRVRK